MRRPPGVALDEWRLAHVVASRSAYLADVLGPRVELSDRTFEGLASMAARGRRFAP